MEAVISLLMATFVGVSLIAAIDFMARRGLLDSGKSWYTQGPAWIVVSHLISLGLLWVLKGLEVGTEQSSPGSFYPWCGIVRRLDDLSLWTMLMGTVVGTAMIWYGKGLVFSGTSGRAVRVTWRIVAPVGLALYTIAVWIGNGTFFWKGSSSFIVRLQWVEGAVVMAYILTSYLFIATLVEVIVSRRPWARMVTVSILIGGVLGLIGIASALCGVVGDGWSNCGFRRQPNYENGRFWAFAALTWWPWLIVFLVALFTAHHASDPSPSGED